MEHLDDIGIIRRGSEMSNFKVPLIIRGKVIEDYEVTHVDRSAGGRSFVTPNPQKYINQIVSESPAILSDL